MPLAPAKTQAQGSLRLNGYALKLRDDQSRQLSTRSMSAIDLSRQIDIEPDPWQRDVLLSEADRILMCCSRQSGKSTTVATLGVHTALSEPKSLVLMVSPGLRQSGELFKKAIAVYRAAGRLVDAETETALTLGLENGSRIVALPGKEGTIRGYSGVRLVIIDESAWVPDDLYISLRPMLAVSHGRMIALSTPHGTRGWWYDAWAKGGEDWERYEVPATECPRISPEFLAQERRTMGQWWFDQEYMCQFLESETQAFTDAEIEGAYSESVDEWAL